MNRKVLCLVMVFGVIITGISGFVVPESADADSVNKHGGELVIGLLNFPKHLNMAVQSGVYTGMPGVQLFAAPLRYDENRNPQPYLAEKWEMAENGLSVTLHLVKNATFHDGHPITSEDVAFSILTVQKNHPFNAMFAPVEKVETPDPHTAVIRLSRPHPAILQGMSSILLPILPKHIFGDGRDIKTHPANMAPVGSGPFRLVEFIPGQHIILERYDKFFIKDRPYLDRIIFKMFKIFDPLALKGGEIQLLPYHNNPMQRRLFENDKNIVVTDKGYDGVAPMFWLAFNLRQKPLDDLRVRQALAYSIDRDFIRTQFEGSSDRKITGPIMPGNPFYSSDVEQYQVDVNKANALLDAAGYPRNQSGKRFALTMDYIPDTSSVLNTEMLLYIKDDLLRKIGVELTLRTLENFAKWAEVVSNGDFMMTNDAVFTWGDPVIGVHRTYDCNNIRKGVIWSNTQGYCNPKVNELMDAAGREMNFEKRKALYAQFQKIVVHDLPVLYIMKVPYLTFYHKNLAGLNDSIWGMLSPFDGVYWKKNAER